MMRPIVFQVPPAAPSNLTVLSTATPGAFQLTWTDNSASETGFVVQRDTTTAFGAPVTLAVSPTGPLNAAGEGISWGGTVTTTDTPGTGTFYYRVQAVDDGFSGAMEQPYNATPVPPATVLASGWSNIATANFLLPTVTFTGAPASWAYSNPAIPFTVTATTNSGAIPTVTASGPCAATQITNPAPTASNTQYSIVLTSGTGTCTLTANWAASGNYAAATATQTTLAVLGTPTVALAYTAGTPTGAYNSSFGVTAATNASVMPTLAGTAGVCTVGAVGGTSTAATATVTMISGTGTCTVTANWAATTNYQAAVKTLATAATKLNSTTTLVSLSPNPAVAGQPVTATVRVASATALTSGATGPAGTVTVTGGGQTCTATLTAGSGTTPSTGTCTLTYSTFGPKTITATYNGDANFNGSGPSASLTEQVRDFGMTASPTIQTVNGNQKATYTVTITSLNGFTGAVALSCAGIYPSTYACSVSQTSVTLTANGSVNVTLTVNTAKGSPGTYTVTTTGKSGTGVPASGGLTHTAQVSIKTNS